MNTRNIGHYIFNRQIMYLVRKPLFSFKSRTMRYIITLFLAVWFTSTSYTQTAILFIPDITAECGTNVTIPVKVGEKDFGNYNSIQFSITWNKNAIDFQKSFTGLNVPPLFLNQNNFGPNSPTFDNDTLTFVWFSGSAIDLQPGTTLFGINFKVLGGGLLNSQIKFINFTPINISGVVNGVPFTNIPNIVTQNGTVTISDNIPPELKCPKDVTVLAPPGSGKAIVNNIYPVQASDNCGVAFLGYTFGGATIGGGAGDPSGSVFNAGITTVTYTINDANNNFNTCNFNILVVDTASTNLKILAKNDTVDCASKKILIPITTQNFKDITSLQFAMKWNNNILQLDTILHLNTILNIKESNFGPIPFNNDTLTFVFDTAVGTTLPFNDTLFTLQYSVIGSGNCTGIDFVSIPTLKIEATQSGIPLPIEIPIDTVNGQICLIDKTKPTIICPQDTFVKVAQGQFLAVVNNIAPVVNDNCGVKSLNYVLSGATQGQGNGNANGKTFFFGTTTVTYTAEDFAGNTATCSFDVIVQDTVLKLIPTTVLALCDSTKFAVNITVQNFTDIIGLQFGMKWDPSVIKFDTVANFDPNLQLNFNNNFGPVIINDTLTFVWFNFAGLNLPDNTTIFTVYFDLVGKAGDLTKFEFISTPTTIIEASNSQGVTGVQPYDALINIFDFTPPSIQCPKDLNLSVAQGLTGLVVNNIAPASATDNCGIKKVSYNYSGSTIGNGNDDASGNFFNIGTTKVTYIVEDFGGNQQSCSFLINIVQDTFQLFTDTIKAECSNGVIKVDVKVKNFTNIASLQFGMTWDPAIVKFDSVGNFMSSLNLLGILQPNSNFGPGIIDDSLTFAWNNYSGVTLPDSSIIFSVYFTPVNNVTSSTFFNFINFPTTPIEVSVKGNPPYVIPYVVYNGIILIDDTEPPIITCPQNITVSTDIDLCTAVVNYKSASAIDNCDPLVTITPGIPASGSIFPKGKTTVSFTATDDFNNTATCSFSITVVDKQKPKLVCPADLTTDNDPGLCGSTVILPQLLDASDNCDVNVSITASEPLVHFYPVGNTKVTYTGTDLAGNMGTCTFKIYVNDLENPVLNNCPKDTIVEPTVNIMNQCFAEVCWTAPTATDNCPNIFISTTNNPCSLFPPGATTVTYTAVDEAGNTNVCSFKVSVQVYNSGFNDCPADITAMTTPDTCGAFVSWVEPYFIDACGDTLDVYSNIGPGEFFPLGTTKVIYITALNSVVLDTCMFNVTVIGQTPYVTGCPSDIKLAVLKDTCGNYPSWIPPVIIGVCGDTIKMTSNIQPDSFLSSGLHTVTYSAANFPSCSFTVEIFDNIKPQHGLCPKDIMYTIPDTIAVCGAFVSWTPPVFTDNCDDNLFIVASDTSGTFFNVGANTVTYVAIDDYGNIDTCSFQIFVRETINPTFLTNCPADITVTALGNACGANVFFTAPTAMDNCDTNVVVTASSPPGFYTAGVSTVTFTATDVAGNTTTCSFTITVLDTMPPIIKCPDPVTISGTGVVSPPSNFIADLVPNECNDLVLFFQQQLAFDNCNPQLIAVQTAPTNPKSGEVFLPGTYSLTYTATDAQANSASCNFDVTVLPYIYNATPESTLSCIGNSVELSSPAVPGATAYNWTGPNGFNASGQVVTVPITSVQSQGNYIVKVILGDCQSNKMYSDTLNINVIPPPDAVNDSLLTVGNFDTLYNVIMLNNDIATQSIKVFIGSVSSGKVILNQDNTITYIPDKNFTGTATIGYFICSVDCPSACDSATIYIDVTDDTKCRVPTFISPNNDALNDILFIKCVETDKYPTNRLIIYNEWGSQIYQASPYKNNWGGTLETIDGKNVPDGTYYYIFYQYAEDQNPLRGFITILR